MLDVSTGTEDGKYAIGVMTNGAIVDGITMIGGVVTLGDSSQMTTSAAPTADADIANKKYVDDNAGAGDPDQNLFETITGITNDVVADTTTDILTLTSAGILTIVGTTATDTILFTATEADTFDNVMDRGATTDQSITTTGGLIYAGVDDTTAGYLHLYGEDDGGSNPQGGEVVLYVAKDHDTTINLWKIQAYNDDLQFRVGAGYMMTFVDNTYVKLHKPLFIEETAADAASVAGLGQFWVSNTSPNRAMFTDDTDRSYQLGVTTDCVLYQDLVEANNEVLSNGTQTWQDETISLFLIQPDVPRQITVTAVNLEFVISQTGTVTINGTDADGATIQEVVTVNNPPGAVTYTTNHAWGKITSYVTDQTGSANAVYMVGINDVVGLPNYPFNANTDVFKTKKNNRDITVPTVVAAYGTVDLATIAAGDDWTFWHRNFK